ncbi:hypothetical protein E2C01_099253 [Portunus trituberculatus]|uniref:Uncharacterized protein n=1 Tax=Portunus trituberculatus TaxID=210409 RepID=A0A5B7K3D6_PORTR|nr:hypothetical protein [Portunus trituberculatus]
MVRRGPSPSPRCTSPTSSQVPQDPLWAHPVKKLRLAVWPLSGNPSADKADGSGFSYSSLNAARSAVSAVAKISGIPAGQNELVCLFMKSAAKQRSKLPRNNFTWDPDVFLRTFDTWGQQSIISFTVSQKSGRFASHSIWPKVSDHRLLGYQEYGTY